MEIIISIFLGYRNSLIAKRKGKNTILWVLITVFAFFFGEFLGAFFVTLFSYRGPMTQEAVQEFLFNNPLKVFFIFFCGLGGYLFTHYLLSRMPDKKEPDQT